MRFEELQRLGDDDLRKELGKANEDLLKLRFRKATNQLENPAEVRKTRKRIAQLKTLMRQRELGQS